MDILGALRGRHITPLTLGRHHGISGSSECAPVYATSGTLRREVLMRRTLLPGLRLFGTKSSVTLDEGLERTVGWYLENELWWRALQGRAGVGEWLGVGG